MSDLNGVMEHLYKAFNRYTSQGIYHCNCGCIDENDVKSLYSKQLHELGQEDLIPYHGSALNTWGGIEHYKYYLPRILDLRIKLERNIAFITLNEIYGKLEDGDWTNWNANEIKAIKDYVKADWFELVNNEESELDETIFSHYSDFIDFGELMNNWNLSETNFGLKNFINFFYSFGNLIFDDKIKVKNVSIKSEFLRLISIENVSQLIENKFFNSTDESYSQKLSVVLQIIENN